MHAEHFHAGRAHCLARPGIVAQCCREAAAACWPALGPAADQAPPQALVAPPVNLPFRCAASCDPIDTMERALALAIAAALLTAAALLSRSSGGRRPGQAHNPLELWRMANVRVEAAPNTNGPPNGPRISCNITSFAGQHAWVEVTWSGVPGGMCTPALPACVPSSFGCVCVLCM